MTAWQFDSETAVTAQSADCWSTRLSGDWNIGTNPNGGYAAAPCVRAMALAAGRPEPISMSVYYLRPALAGERGEVRTEQVRSGRRANTMAAALIQDGKERLRCLGLFTELNGPADAGPQQTPLSIPPVNLPPPGQCPARDAGAQGVDLPIASRLDVRLAPALAQPGRAERAEVAGWVRFADGRPPDAAALVLFADAFPPSVFSLLGRVGWVPTLELTVHVRRRPAQGWIAARFRTRDLADGLMVEDGELWDSTGALVAQSRQLALLRSDRDGTR